MLLLIIGLILIGILLLVLEILVLPGMVAGILGTIFLLISILWMYSSYGTNAGHITLVATLAVAFIAIYSSLKSKAWKKYGLNNTISGRVNEVDDKGIMEGDEGKTLSALRPSGTILINDQRIEAQSSGEMIDTGTKVIVLKVLPNKVIVKIKVSELN
jgi:membrane-bound ClpP family serine protease